MSASILPYDDPDPIVVLPVYADSELGVSSTWVGDLDAGSSVMLLSVYPNNRLCFVEGGIIKVGIYKGGWHVIGSSSMDQYLSVILRNGSSVSLLSFIPE